MYNSAEGSYKEKALLEQKTIHRGLVSIGHPTPTQKPRKDNQNKHDHNTDYRYRQHIPPSTTSGIGDSRNVGTKLTSGDRRTLTGHGQRQYFDHRNMLPSGRGRGRGVTRSPPRGQRWPSDGYYHDSPSNGNYWDDGAGNQDYMVGNYPAGYPSNGRYNNNEGYPSNDDDGSASHRRLPSNGYNDDRQSLTAYLRSELRQQEALEKLNNDNNKHRDDQHYRGKFTVVPLKFSDVNCSMCVV